MPITKVKHKKGNKLSKLINTSDTDDESSEHELSYYVNDRVKLMKEVLKIIKPKKIKSMAPDCMKVSNKFSCICNIIAIHRYNRSVFVNVCLPPFFYKVFQINFLICT